MLKWKNPTEVENVNLRVFRKVAAVDPNTYMITGIYPNIIAAAKAKGGRPQIIADAINKFHSKAYGYYWKRI